MTQPHTTKASTPPRGLAAMFFAFFVVAPARVTHLVVQQINIHHTMVNSLNMVLH